MAELDNQRRRLMSLIAKKNDQRTLVSLIADKGDSRITIRETDDGLGIYNPSQHFMPVIIFLLLWLGGWGLGEFFVLYEIFYGGDSFVDIFLIIWVTFWTLGGLAAWCVVLWQLFGVERLFITSGGVVREASIGWLRRRWIFPIEKVSNFRLAAPPAKKAKKKDPRKSRGTGAISFDVSDVSHHFGVGMSKEEAELALAAIRRHLKALDTDIALDAPKA